MLALNLAYEEALRLAAPKRANTYTHTLPPQDAKQLAQKMLRQNNPESALRQLLRYRQGALDAALAMKESATLHGKLKQLLHRKK